MIETVDDTLPVFNVITRLLVEKQMAEVRHICKIMKLIESREITGTETCSKNEITLDLSPF